MTEEEFDREIADIIGEHLESLIALIVGIGGKAKTFGVSSKLHIAGTSYRYEFVAVKEGTELYEKMEENYEEVRGQKQ